MTTTELDALKQSIAQIMQDNTNLAPGQALAMLPVSIKSLQGKLYEARVLAEVCQELVSQEQCTLRLAGGGTLF